MTRGQGVAKKLTPHGEIREIPGSEGIPLCVTAEPAGPLNRQGRQCKSEFPLAPRGDPARLGRMRRDRMLYRILDGVGGLARRPSPGRTAVAEKRTAREYANRFRRSATAVAASENGGNAWTLWAPQDVNAH